MSADALIAVVVPLIVVAAMTAVGLELRFRDFTLLARTPGLVLAGLCLPPLLLPFVAVGLIAFFAPPPAVAVGLLLVAACPVGGVSSTFAYLAGASTSLSVTLTALSCLLATVSIPMLDLVYGSILQQSLGLQVPLGPLLAQLVAAVVAPVTVGMAIRKRWPAVAERYRGRMRQLAFAALFLLLVLTVAADVPGFLAMLPACVPIAAAFVVVSFAIGAAAGQLVTRDPRARATLAIEFATRNVAIATTIAVAVLGRVEYATFATAYFLTEVPVMMLGVVLIRRILDPRRTTEGTASHRTEASRRDPASNVRV